MYAKVTKILKWVLLLIGVAIAVFGIAYGFTTDGGIATDVLLYCAYALVAFAILAVVCLGLYLTIKQNPKGLIKLGIALVAAVVVVGIAYLLAPGTEAVGCSIAVTPGTLKFTDTILNVTYLLCGGAILSIVVGAIISASRNK